MLGLGLSFAKQTAKVFSFVRDQLKLLYRFYDNSPELLLSGATSFDGTNDYVNTGTPFSNTNHTISAWVNASATGGVVFDNRDANDDGIRFLYDSNLTYQLNSSDITVSNPSLNTWHHIACTYDGTTQKLYLNGSLVASASTSQTVSVSQNLVLGKQSYSDVAYLNGSIANVGIWNRALSLSEIESIYWKGQYADLKGTELTNLVSWYNLSADANDSTGTNNGTNNGATFLTDAYSASSPFLPRIQDKATPKGAVALASGSTSFATDDFVNLGQASNLNFDTDADDFTIAMWFKIASGDTGTLICKGGDTSGDRQYHIYYSSSDYIAVNIGGTVVNTNAYDDGNWHHVAVVNFDDSGTQKFRIYIDGSSVGLGTSGSGSNSLDVLLGARRGSSNSNTAFLFDGSMANVAIYSDAKTQSQIQDIMFSSYSTLTSALKTNLVSWYDLGSTEYGSDIIPTSFSGGNQSFSDGVLTINSSATYAYNSQLTENLKYRLTYTIATISSGSINVSFHTGTNQGTDRNSVGTYTEELTVTGNSTWYFKPSSFTGTLTNIVLNEVQAPDSQGDNEGSIYGATTNTGYTSSPSGVADPLNYGEVYGGNCIRFDGVNDTLDCVLGSSDIDKDGTGAINFWYYGVDPNSTYGISMNLAGADDNYRFFNFQAVGAGDTRVGVVSNAGFSYVTITDNLDDKWSMITLIVSRSGGSGGTFSIYINGVLKAENQSFSGVFPSTPTRFRMGAFIGDSHFSSFRTNNVKIFNTALTQDQVRELYKKPELTLPTGIASSALKLDMPMQEGSGVAILDGSGNQNHGTGDGITWATGQEYGFQHPLVRSNNPMRFETSDYVTVSKNSGTQISTGTYSVSVWIKPEGGTDSGTNYEIIDAESYNNNGWLIRLTGTDLKPYVRHNQASSATALSSTTAVTNGVWSHLVFVFASGTGAWYINGSLINSGSITAPVLGTTDMQIGGRSAQYFDGFINELSIWDSALTANEVTALYNSGLPLLPTTDSGNYASADDLMGYWRNDGVTTWLDKANTGVASFDGVNDSLNLDGFNFSGNQATFSFWVNLNTIETTFLIDLNPNRFIIGLSDPDTHLGVYDGSSWKFFGALSAGVWSHLVIVLNNTTASAYVNGSQLGSDQTITAINVASASDCVIGANYPPNNYYIDGKLASTNIFNTALSATEVSELYAIDKRSSISGFSQFSNCVGSWLMGAGTGDTTSTIQDQTSNNNDATVSGANLIGYNDGTVSGSPASIIVPEGLNEGRDSQGYYLTDTDSISSGIRLKGAEYISVQDSESLSFGNGTSDSPFSLEAWIKPNDVTHFEVFAKGVYNSTGEYLFGFEVDDKLKFYLFDESVASTAEGVLYNTALTSSEGQWMHIVGTYDGRGGTSANAGMKIYLNGSQVNNGTESAGTYVAMENLSANLEIGKYSSNYAKGSIDEAKVYAKELSATEVLKNYNNGKSAHSN